MHGVINLFNTEVTGMFRLEQNIVEVVKNHVNWFRRFKDIDIQT